MDRAKQRVEARGRIRERIRRKVTGTSERPRLAVFRSLKSIYAQLIDDSTGKTIVSASSLEKDAGAKGSNAAAAKAVGVLIAKKTMIAIAMSGTTIPHAIVGHYGAGKVLLKPASEGTGVIAGGPVRAILESAGIQNILTKSLGTANPHNVVKATFEALKLLRTEDQYKRL